MTTSELSYNDPQVQRAHRRPSSRNVSGLMPAGRAVLVEPYQPEIKKSIIEIPSTVSERQQMIETRAVVIDVGAAAWDDEPEPRAFVGEKVMLTRYAGVMVRGTADGKMYRMINDRDIFCRIEVENNV